MDWKLFVIIVLGGIIFILLAKLQKVREALKDAQTELMCAGTCLTEATRQRDDLLLGSDDSYEEPRSADTNMTAEEEAELEDLDLDEGGQLQAV